MITNDTQPEMTESKSNQNWIWWLVGGGLALLLICCLVVAAGAALYFLLAPTTGQVFSVISTEVPANPPPIPSTVNIPEPRLYPMAEGSRMGDPNAPVKIIEYSDFQCPYCVRYWEETEEKIIENYVATGKVFYEFHSNGSFIGPESGAAAEAAYCAGAQNQFWEYHDLLFANWTGENVGDFRNENLIQFAIVLNLNQSAFEQCLKSGNYADRVQQDAANAKADGVTGTPSFLINGKLIEGAQPYSVFESEIEAALNAK